MAQEKWGHLSPGQIRESNGYCILFFCLFQTCVCCRKNQFHDMTLFLPVYDMTLLSPGEMNNSKMSIHLKYLIKVFLSLALQIEN